MHLIKRKSNGTLKEGAKGILCYPKIIIFTPSSAIIITFPRKSYFNGTDACFYRRPLLFLSCYDNLLSKLTSQNKWRMLSAFVTLMYNSIYNKFIMIKIELMRSYVKHGSMKRDKLTLFIICVCVLLIFLPG